MATVRGSFSSVSHAWVSGRGRSKKFRVCCTMVVLLRGRFFAVVLRWGTALEESIDDGAGVKQVWGETQRRVRFYFGERNRGAGTEVRPLGRDEGTTSIRQDQDEM
jgi:hypothetical protein